MQRALIFICVALVIACAQSKAMQKYDNVVVCDRKEAFALLINGYIEPKKSLVDSINISERILAGTDRDCRLADSIKLDDSRMMEISDLRFPDMHKAQMVSGFEEEGARKKVFLLSYNVFRALYESNRWRIINI